MDITFVTNATSDEDARKLLTELGLPFKIKKLELWQKNQ